VRDELKDAAIVVFSLALLSGIARWRGEHALTHDLSRSLKGGHIETDIEPRGLLGLITGNSSVTTVRGRGFATDELPFRLQPAGRAKVHVSSLRFDFEDFRLKNLPVRRLTAEFPGVSLDAGKIAFDERIVIRRAGEGKAEAVVGADALQQFIARKYAMLKDVQVRLTSGWAEVAATAPILGGSTRVEGRCRFAPVEGKYIHAAEASFRLNGKDATEAMTKMLLGMLNPIVDSDKDMGLGKFVYLTEVMVGEGNLTLRGRVRVPEDK
jgi:hypothetical protein